MSAGRDAPPPSPAPVMALATGYWASQAFLTANRVGLFRTLAEGARDAAALARTLGTDPHRTRLLLDACTALGLVERTGDGAYRNAPVARAYLVPGKPGYLGDAVSYGEAMYAPWGELERSLRDGTPVVPAEYYLGGDVERTRRFVRSMHDRAIGIGQALVHMVDLAGRSRLLDIAGGGGTYAVLFCRRFPGLRAIVLELPEVAQIAREIVAEMGAADRVETLAGDYGSTPFPDGCDVVLMSGMFHRETEATCRKLIGRARDALPPGGLLIVSDVFASAEGDSTFAALFGLNMALSAPNGGVHGDADVARWMADGGFAEIAVRPFPPPLPHRVVTGARR